MFQRLLNYRKFLAAGRFERFENGEKPAWARD